MMETLTHAVSSPFLQFESLGREGLEAPPTGQNKDGVYQCKKHSSAGTYGVASFSLVF
jgi:hypothetical protein